MRCVLINTEADFIWMEAVLGTRRVISVDTETNMLDTFCNEFQMVGLSLAGDTQTGYYIPIAHRTPPDKEDIPQPKQLSPQWVTSRLNTFLRGRRVSGANHKFDSHVFDRYGTCMGVTVFDALLAAYVYDSRDCGMGLKDIVFTRLGYKAQEIDELCKEVKPKSKKHPNKKRNGVGFEFLEPEVALSYAAADAVNVQRLHKWYAPRIKADEGLDKVMALEIEVAPIIKDMETCGVLLDEAKLRQFHDDLLIGEKKFEILLKQITGNPDINPKSGAQVGDLLYHQMGLRHPKGFPLYKQGSVPPKGWMDKDVIKDILSAIKRDQSTVYGDSRIQQWTKEQVIDLLSSKILSGKLAKLRSTYTLNLLDLRGDDGRLHTDYKQLVETGRLASSSPNLMNLPRGDDKETKKYDIRSAFIADPGFVFVKADYAAQETRMLAALSGDPVMYDIFTGAKRDDEGDEIDTHIYVATMAFDAPYLDIKHAVQKKKRGEELTPRDKELIQYRQDAKPVTFGIAYGVTDIGLAEQLNNTRDFATGLISAWKNKAFVVAAQWLEYIPIYAKQNLYVLSYYGRKRRMSEGARYLPEWEFNSRIANQMKNAPIQSGSADMTKLAMIRIHNALEKEIGLYNARISGMVHDEVITLCREEYAEQVRVIMEREMQDTINGIPFPAEAVISKTQSKEG